MIEAVAVGVGVRVLVAVAVNVPVGVTVGVWVTVGLGVSLGVTVTGKNVGVKNWSGVGGKVLVGKGISVAGLVGTGVNVPGCRLVAVGVGEIITGRVGGITAVVCSFAIYKAKKPTQ